MMQAYLNDPKLKAETVAAMEADIAAERLVSGGYWNGETGCFVGCVIRGESHSKFEIKIGVPRVLARIGDRIFEGLKRCNERQKFAIDFLKAIPEGADLSGVWDKFAVFMLIDEEFGVVNFAKKDYAKKLIRDIADMYKRKISGEKIDANTWLDLRRSTAVAYAAAYAVDAYAYAVDAYAVAAAAAAAVRSRHYAALASALIRFLSEAPQGIQGKK